VITEFLFILLWVLAPYAGSYSKDNLDENEARNILIKSFHQLIEKNKNYDEPIEIVSGLTNIGIPRIAYQVAEELDFIKVGISAERALKVKCGIYPVDKQIIEGQDFGDESRLFISYIDFLVRVGGGRQSHQEVKMFIEKCAEHGISVSERLIENDFALIK